MAQQQGNWLVHYQGNQVVHIDGNSLVHNGGNSTPYQKSVDGFEIDQTYYDRFSNNSQNIKVGTYFLHNPWQKGSHYASKYFEIGNDYLAFIVTHDPEQPEETDAAIKSIVLYTVHKGKDNKSNELNVYLNGYSEGTNHDLHSEIKDIDGDKIPEIIQRDFSYEHNETVPKKPKIKVFAWKRDKFVENIELVGKVNP